MTYGHTWHKWSSFISDLLLPTIPAAAIQFINSQAQFSLCFLNRCLPHSSSEFHRNNSGHLPGFQIHLDTTTHQVHTRYTSWHPLLFSHLHIHHVKVLSDYSICQMNNESHVVCFSDLMMGQHYQFVLFFGGFFSWGVFLFNHFYTWLTAKSLSKFLNHLFNLSGCHIFWRLNSVGYEYGVGNWLRFYPRSTIHSNRTFKQKKFSKNFLHRASSTKQSK